MSSDPRGELEAAVLRATRRLGREASLFSQSVAERVGLALTDIECLDLLTEGPISAGGLAELTGLTSGATTRMIDRLEQAGYVRRVADPADRRRVMVEVVPERMKAIGALHGPILRAQQEVIARFSHAELATISRYLDGSIGVAQTEARRMHEPEEPESGAAAASFAAPVAGVTKARLVFLSGAPNIALHGDDSIAELYRARFDGPVPRVRVRGAVVTVSYPRFGWFDWRARIGDINMDASVHWRKDRGDIALNSKVRWAIELRGGVSRLNADLRSIDLEGIELRGGGSKIELTLPAPVGVVPIRLTGGAGYLGVRRPAGAAIGLALMGGASYLSLDGERIKGTGSLSMESPGASSSKDRYEVHILGGANKIVVA